MLVARHQQEQQHPSFEAPQTAFGAVVARQLSVWPFATQTQKLFLLVDPSVPDPALRRGVLRAMQQAYFRSDSYSQTRAVREAALAAHYVLRHHNRDALPAAQITAASAVAATRGNVAFVALAGNVAAFAWRDEALTGERGTVRLAQPLGLEQDPRLILWTTPLAHGDVLVLVCGAAWHPESAQVIADILRTTRRSDVAEERLASALGGSSPAGVLIANPLRDPRGNRHLTVVPAVPAPPSSEGRRRAPRQAGVAMGRRWLWPLVVVGLFGYAALVAIGPAPGPPRLTMIQQAEALLAQADQTADVYQAHALAESALDLARQAMPAPEDAGGLVSLAARKLDEIDQVYPVSPALAVRLGPSGGNVVDLAVGDDGVYTLDVVESSVRVFGLDGLDQQPTPDTLLVRKGAAVGVRRLETPVAIQYLNGASSGVGALTIVDEARTVVQAGRDRVLAVRSLASSASWRELGALGATANGSLYLLDSGSRRLLLYPVVNQRLVDPPRVLLDDATRHGVAFERAAEVLEVAVGQQREVLLRMDDGTLHRFDPQGNDLAIMVRPPDGRSTSVSAAACDRAGGLFLADPAHARILHTTADGALLRQLRDPALAGLRQIQSSLDGRRLYGLVATGVLVFDLP